MIKATSSDRHQMIELLLEFFEDNSNINSIVKNDHKKQQRLTSLAEYMFDWGLAMDAIYLTNSKKGFAIIYLSNKKLNIIKEIHLDLKLIFKVITLYRLLKIIKRRLNVLKIRKNEAGKGEYLYFYAFGVSKKYRGITCSEGTSGMSASFQVRDFMLDLMKKHQLPMYVETVNPRNKRLYEHFGFVTYDEYYDKNRNFKTWFLKKIKI